MNSLISKVVNRPLFSVLTVTLIFLGGCFFLYEKTFKNFDNVAESFQTSYLLEYLVQSRPIKSLEQAIAARDTARAASELAYFEDAIQKIHLATKDQEALKLFQNSKELRKSLEELKTLPSIYDLLRLFHQKVFSLKLKADKKGWENLDSSMTRVLKRAHKITRQDIISKGLVSAIEKDLARSETLVEKSSLDDSDKKSVLKDLKSINLEWKMLQKNLDLGARVMKKAQALAAQTQSWTQGLAPDLSLRKLGLQKIKQHFFAVGAGFFAVLILLLAFLAMRKRAHTQSLKAAIEHRFLTLLTNNLMKNQKQEFRDLSDRFNLEFKKCVSFFHKNVDLANCFRSAVPFPVLVLDDKMRIFFSNQHFSQKFGIAPEKLSETGFLWESFRKKTSIGVDDPVGRFFKESHERRLKQQIQVLVNEERKPFEMHAYRMENESRQFCILTFYPLEQYVESIQKQSQSLLAPIVKSLEALRQSAFNESFKAEIQTEFKAGGHEEVFSQIKLVSQSYQSEKDQLHAEIQAQASTMQDQRKEIEDFKGMCAKLSALNKASLERFKSLKSTLIGMMEKNSDYASLSHDLMHMGEESVDKFAMATKINREIYSLYQQGHDVNLDIQQSKTVLRDYRKELSSLGQKFLKSCDKEGGLNPSAMNSIDLLSDVLEKLEKQFMQFEVFVSKADLVFSAAQMKRFQRTLEEESEGMKKMRTLLENYFGRLSAIEKELAPFEEQTLGIMQDIHAQFRESMQTLALLPRPVDDNGGLFGERHDSRGTSIDHNENELKN